MLLYEGLTFRLRRAIFNVYNALGYGHKEIVYQKAFARELHDIGLSFEREKILAVKYKDEKVGSYQPDFIVEEKVIVELKSVEFVPKIYEDQLLHYLKSTDYKLGLLVNFGCPKLTIKRLIWTDR